MTDSMITIVWSHIIIIIYIQVIFVLLGESNYARNGGK